MITPARARFSFARDPITSQLLTGRMHAYKGSPQSRIDACLRWIAPSSIPLSYLLAPRAREGRRCARKKPPVLHFPHVGEKGEAGKIARNIGETRRIQVH